MPRSFAEAVSGKWACYNSNDFDNPDFGAEDAEKHTAGMNAVASHVPAGTVISIKQQGTWPSVVCVKH